MRRTRCSDRLRFGLQIVQAKQGDPVSTNPFQSPASEPIAPRQGRPIRTSIIRSVCSVILGGGVVDFLGSSVAFFVIFLVVIFSFGDSRDDADWIQSSSFRYGLKAIGISFSLVGGRIAAFFAGHGEKSHALAATCIALVASFVFQGIDRTSSGVLTVTACFGASALAGQVVGGR